MNNKCFRWDNARKYAKLILLYKFDKQQEHKIIENNIIKS